MACAFEKIWSCYKNGCSVSFTAREINDIYKEFKICVLIVEFWFDKFSEDDFDYNRTYIDLNRFKIDPNTFRDFVNKYNCNPVKMLSYVFQTSDYHIRSFLYILEFIPIPFRGNFEMWVPLSNREQ
ncbi:hypothetical protein M0804_009822 [Polistes exclamans]|nr:hypothetical protein M0804_009822 [Polistes exclamans]